MERSIVKILIAEDELVSRTMLEGVLTDWGHEVTVATNGDEAWQSLQSEHAPSLAILDWEMPGQNGPEICRKLREKHTPTPVYIILLTSRSAKLDIVEGLRSGANDYLTKPFDQNELLARVHPAPTQQSPPSSTSVPICRPGKGNLDQPPDGHGGVAPSELSKLHGELIAFSWADQNTGQVPCCYRVTSSGLRAIQQVNGGVDDDGEVLSVPEKPFPKFAK